MREENIKLKYETIGVKEQRNLIEATRDLSRAMTKEEYFFGNAYLPKSCR